mgnify:CR=1 FL=1
MENKLAKGVTIAVAVGGLLTIIGYFTDIGNMTLFQKTLIALACAVICAVAYLTPKNKQTSEDEKPAEIDKFVGFGFIALIVIGFLFISSLGNGGDRLDGDEETPETSPGNTVWITPSKEPVSTPTQSQPFNSDPPTPTLFEEAYTYYDNGQYDLSFPLFMQAAKEGDSNGELYVGCSYRDGKGVKQDSSAAFSWFSIAANHGNAQAQYNLGYCYYRGDGVRANSSLAFEWFQKSAEQGNKFGLLWTGFCYHKGIGVTKSLDDAEIYYEAAIKAGNQDAADRLADLIQERGY